MARDDSVRLGVELASLAAIGVGVGAACGWAWGLVVCGGLVLAIAVLGRLR